jgi:hypothetical protein
MDNNRYNLYVMFYYQIVLLAYLKDDFLRNRLILTYVNNVYAKPKHSISIAFDETEEESNSRISYIIIRLYLYAINA